MLKLWGQSFLIAFSMYSTIPVPMVEWNEKNMKYAMVFFPFVGVIEGALLWLLFWAGQSLEISAGLFGALAAVLPIAVTGGIHLDGFCDTCDALSSHRDREEKLRILKDSHIGAFALICCSGLLLVKYGLFQQLYLSSSYIFLTIGGFVLSRALSGLAVVTFPRAKKDGLVSTFANMAERRNTGVCLGVETVLCGIGMVLTAPLAGSLTLLAALLWFGGYYWMSEREFGGVTGDLAGYFLEICELLLLAVPVLLALFHL